MSHVFILIFGVNLIIKRGTSKYIAKIISNHTYPQLKSEHISKHTIEPAKMDGTKYQQNCFQISPI
ncbi:hypothetical protein HMPREF1870_01706 [Bacteroidales bacterium KA00344]|nr:hypothetical protein HMPREF1870_01706 [Bacteroidales bacterium KA00344]